MSSFKLLFEHIDVVPVATVTKNGIKYGFHEFNARVTIKDPETKKDREVTVVRRAEREWMLGGGEKCFINKHGATIFDLDDKILKTKAEAVQKLIFGDKK